MANVSAFTGAMPVIPGGLVEQARVTRTTDFTVSDTASPGTTDFFSTDLEFVADGGTYLVTFYAPYAQTATNSGAEIIVNLVKGDGTNVGRIAYIGKPDGGGGWNAAPIFTQYHYTPSAGTQTLNVRAWRTVANGTIGANTNYTPAFLSVSKIVNQNDGLKPFWTPPVVTQLPSQATVGDQVVNYTTNGAYQPYFYTGATDGWKQVGTSKPPSCRAIRNSDYTYSNHTAVQWNNDSTSGQAWDTDGMWSSGANTRVTMNTPGIYIITASFYITGTSNITVSQSYIRVNGSVSLAELDIGQNKQETLGSLTSTFVSDGDDYVELLINNTGGGTLTFKGSINHLGATWIGPTP